MNTNNTKLALLLDLNGTIIYRSAKPIEKSQVIGIKSRGRWLYPRPGAECLLSELAKHYYIYICTTMYHKNAVSSLEVITPTYLQYIRTVLDREYDKEDPHWRTSGGNEWDMIYDTKKIWPRIIPNDERSCIFVDNEQRKCIECPRNCLVIPEMSLDEFICNDSSILVSVTNYLTKLAHIWKTQSNADIRILLETNYSQSISDESAESLEKVVDACSTSFIIPNNSETTIPISKSLSKLTNIIGCRLEDCRLTLEHIIGDEAHFLDIAHHITATVKLPLPTGIQLERKIALIRLLILKVNKNIYIDLPIGTLKLTWLS